MLLSEWSWGRDVLNVVYVCKDEDLVRVSMEGKGRVLSCVISLGQNFEG